MPSLWNAALSRTTAPHSDSTCSGVNGVAEAAAAPPPPPVLLMLLLREGLVAAACAIVCGWLW